MRDRHFEAVLSFDHLTLEVLDVLVFLLPDLIEFFDHGAHLLLFFFFGEGSSLLVLLELRQSINNPLHALDLDGA